MFVVNSSRDLGDADLNTEEAWTGEYLADGVTKEVTLRAAIQQVNSFGIQAQRHEITFLAQPTEGGPVGEEGPPLPPPQQPLNVYLTSPMDDIRVPVLIAGNGKDINTITRGASAGNFPLFTIATTVTNEVREAVVVKFSYLTITGGRGVPDQNAGGAIHNTATLVLTDVDLRDNRAYQGGAIYNATTGVATLTNCVLANNQAVGDGADGGAIYTTGDGRITINDSILSSNSATLKGGAIHMNVHSRVALFNTNLSNNTAVEGGAVYASVGDANAIPFQMTGGRVWNNTATNGGALYFSTTNARLDGVSLDNNSATETGGAIFLKQHTLELLNCTFADNTATRLGPHLVYVGILGTSVWITRTNTPTLGDTDLVQWVAP
jgi:predicted outer membrane repeat protein